MASHHHHCNQPNLHTASQHPTPCYFSPSCCTPYTPCHHHAPPPPDPHLHHHHHYPPSPQPQLYSTLARRRSSHQYSPRFEERCFQEEKLANPTISSLLLRIAALESAVRIRSSSSSHFIRDAAARTIQTHFRAFLLRRSRTLRQLKDLATIKSELSFLKLSVSDKTHFNYDVGNRKAEALLVKLFDIQGGDPMIREGKISVSRDLNRFLDYIDGLCVERMGFSSGVNVRCVRNNLKSRVSSSARKMYNVKCRGLKKVNEEKLRGLVERIDKLAVELDEEEDDEIDSPMITTHGVSGNRNGVFMKQLSAVQPKKRVSFAEDGKVYRLLRRNHEPYLDKDKCDDSLEMGNLVDAKEFKDDICREVEEIGVSSKEAEDDEEDELQSEDEGSLPGSDGEKELRSYPRGKR